MTIQLPLLLKTHRKMYNISLFKNVIQDVIQVNTNHVRLKITGFIDSFGALIATTNEEINTFLCDTHSSNSAKAAAVRILIKPKLSTSIKAVKFELNDRNLCNALIDEANLDAIDMDKINILQSNRN